MTIGIDPAFWRAVETRKAASGAPTVLKGVVNAVATGTATVTIGEETFPPSPKLASVTVGQVVYCLAFSQGKLLVLGGVV